MSPEAIKIVGRLRSKIDVILTDGVPPRGELMGKAIRHIDNYWNQIFLYLFVGHYSMGNALNVTSGSPANTRFIPSI